MENINYELLGKRIRKARKEMGLTQAELGVKVGVSDSHISHIENGNARLSFDRLLSILSVLDISPEEVLIEQVDNEKASQKYSDVLASRIHALPIRDQRTLAYLIDSLEKSNSGK